MNDDGIAGKVALVTGAAGGIGAAVAGRLARQGARVAAADADTGALQETVRQWSGDGRQLHAYKLDVTDATAVAEVTDQVESELGPVDILVNVAGILRVGPVLELGEDDWATVFAVNTHGVVRVSRAVAARMRDRRRGAVVTVASNAAGVPRMGMAAYCASKAATAIFTKCLGLELAGCGVRCNVVAPGSTDTPMLTSMWTDGYGPAEVVRGDAARYRVGIPLGKLATPDDVADAVTFLASDRAGHITMQELYVDGGAALGY